LQDQSGIRKLLSGFVLSASNQSRAMKDSGLNRLPDRKESRESLIEKEAERLRQTMGDYGLDPDKLITCRRHYQGGHDRVITTKPTDLR
jgi:hypothetical protein